MIKSSERGILLKSKICFILSYLWTSVMMFFAPICIGIIYMDITGHSKGYSYDLGPEKDISIGIGIFELIIWLALLIPPSISLFRKIHGKKIFIVISLAWYVLLFITGVMFIGGWQEFGRAFHP